MREIKQLFGINREEVNHYISMLETETRKLQKIRYSNYKSFHAKKTELLKQIERLNTEITSLDEMEHNICLWIEKNK